MFVLVCQSNKSQKFLIPLYYVHSQSIFHLHTCDRSSLQYAKHLFVKNPSFIASKYTKVL